MPGDPDRLDDLNPDIFVRYCPELSEKRTAAGVPETDTPAALDQTKDRQNPHRISSGGGVFFVNTVSLKCFYSGFGRFSVQNCTKYIFRALCTDRTN